MEQKIMLNKEEKEKLFPVFLTGRSKIQIQLRKNDEFAKGNIDQEIRIIRRYFSREKRAGLESMCNQVAKLRKKVQEVWKEKPELIEAIMNIIEESRREALRALGILAEEATEGREDYSEVTIRVEGLIFKSGEMRRIVQFTKRCAKEDWPVLVTGETGTGKELIAKLIHKESPRRSEEFVAINCAAIPSELLESELFGYKKGSFTGAINDKKGLFETVGKGTIFLDEIGEMDPRLQAKILRVIQEKRFRKIGDTNGGQEFSGRIISATNRNLAEEIRNGKFREDLLHRLGELRIQIPPLRKRPIDIDPLINHLMPIITREKEWEVTEEAREKIKKRPLTGNVRELEGLLKQAYILATLEWETEPIIIKGDHIAN